ncbi:MAG TPA: AraC family transcriptional regulator [Ignavibacteria bacterium]|nr:AraC family transcriptional regulator [Ignavibacteria bacterium]HMR39525.1 AraC family transcriptional regulator [Ignavibacteria bacterium]
MILRNYPESVSEIRKNFIVHFTDSDKQMAKHLSPLSIKCSMKGKELHRTSEGNYEVTPGQYLLINSGQKCESRIENPAESFSVYFESEFANDSLRSLVSPSEKLLNYSYIPGIQHVNFLEKLYPHNNILSPSLMRLRLASKVNHDEEDFITESCFELIEKLLMIHRDLYKEIEKLPPVKLSTKMELYKRICRAKEYMDSSFTENITLEKISREACLSQFHFLRLFKVIHQKTPHKYLTEKRIEKALSLLFQTDKSITEICFDIGFESVSSFSWLFKKKLGLSPDLAREQYRYHMSKLKVKI